MSTHSNLSNELRIDLVGQVREFMRRDYVRDIDDLNRALGKAKKGAPTTAGFENLPPIPFSSDPFVLQPGNCIAVIGLNPKFQDPDKSAKARKEYQDLKNDVAQLDLGGLERFLQRRAEYFTDKNPNYYGRYFTKLGGHIGRTWLRDCIASSKSEGADFAKQVFGRYVFKSDFLPWFSANTDSIDPRKFAEHENKGDIEPLKIYRELLFAFLVALRPRWIQCNGLQMEEYARAAFPPCSTVTPDGYGSNRKKRLVMYKTSLSSPCLKEGITLPVVLHGFTNSQLGPQSREDFEDVDSRFRTWVNREMDSAASFFSFV